MREPLLLIADIHGNLEALQAVLEDASDRLFERIVCLGDLVGYGPDPEACMERVRSLNAEVILGNHDAAVTGELELSWFNPLATEAIRWTRDRLSEDSLTYLEGLPSCWQNDWLEAYHGSPRQPLREYVHGVSMARLIARRMTQPVLGVAHTHVSALYRGSSPEGVEQIRFSPGEATSLDLEHHLQIVNPGSVGQPRDGDPRAAYLVVDPLEETAVWHRVQYDVEAVQRKIRAADLPEKLATRLTYGT